MTYSQLEQCANRPARYLRAPGVGAEVLVGVQRGPFTRHGGDGPGNHQPSGAYLFLDLASPADCLALMLADTHLPVLLTLEQSRNGLPEVAGLVERAPLLARAAYPARPSTRHGDTGGRRLSASIRRSTISAVALFSRAPDEAKKAEARMATVLIFHEVDDVDHWLGSPRRAEVGGPIGVTMRTFVDPEKTNRVGVIAEVPDMDAFRQFMASEAVADAMKYDGVRPETVVMLVES